MDVAVDVIFGSDPPLDAVKELHTASPHPGAGEVTEAQWRTVSDEDVHVLRDEVPLVEALLAPGEVEGPASVDRLVRSACNHHISIFSKLILIYTRQGPPLSQISYLVIINQFL